MQQRTDSLVCGFESQNLVFCSVLNVIASKSLLATADDVPSLALHFYFDVAVSFIWSMLSCGKWRNVECSMGSFIIIIIIKMINFVIIATWYDHEGMQI